MAKLNYPIDFSENVSSQVRGQLELDEPLPFQSTTGGSGFYRPGTISLRGGGNLEIVLYHNEATAQFMYVRTCEADPNLFETAGLSEQEITRIGRIVLPGQLCLGAERSRVIGRAIKHMFGSPALSPIFAVHRQQNLAIFPIAREGLKYQVADAIYDNYGYYCDEVVLDAHHVFDSSVPIYNRKVEMTLFKDKDLDKEQRGNITVAFLADSIASGLVMKEVIARVKERFDRLQQIEVIAPLSSVRGLCRVAQAECIQDIHVRVHVFETLLNALPPDYYYSAHYNAPDFHIRTDLEAEYRAWWGKDAAGNAIADTACAGYGWSEVFYSPRKQIEMINSQLETRHGLTIADVIRRNIR